MTIFKANLAACVVFALAILAIGSAAQRSLPRFTLDDMAIVAACTKPAWLWAAGAWVTRGRRRLSRAWLAASAVLIENLVIRAVTLPVRFDLSSRAWVALRDGLTQGHAHE